MGQIQNAINDAGKQVAGAVGILGAGEKAGTAAVSKQITSDITSVADTAKDIRQEKRAAAVNDALKKDDTKRAHIENTKPDSAIKVSEKEMLARDPHLLDKEARIVELKEEYNKLAPEGKQLGSNFNFRTAARDISRGRAPADMEEQYYKKALQNMAKKTSLKTRMLAGISAIVGRTIGD